MTNGSIKILLAAFLATAIYSCEDTTSTIGSSLTGSNVEIVIDSAFTVTGETLRRPTITPKSNALILGSLALDNYGSIKSDVVAQFLPSTALDTADFSYQNVDSLFLVMRYALGNFIGDSVAPLGVTVYPLTAQLPADIASDFDPKGYYNPTPIATTTYNTLSASNPLNSSQNYREIMVKLPTSLGRYIFKSFEDNPDNFANGQLFSENVFPGLYIKSSFGSGRMTVISSTSLTFYLRKITPIDGEKNDTTDAVHQYMLVTPEVISNNDLTYNMSPVLQKYFDEGKDLLVAPAGYEMEIKLPAEKLMSAFRTGGQGAAVLNSLSMSIPTDSIINNGNVTPPPYVLLVLKKDRDEFFAKNKLTDNITSFYAEWSRTTCSYDFSSMRSYLLDLLAKEEVTEEDYTFSLVPVQVNFEALVSDSYYSSSVNYTESDIQPYLLSPAMGTVDLSKVKIKLTYSHQTQQN